MKRVEAIKKYFGDIRPVENKELIELKRADSEGYEELAQGAARELGVELE